jgi:hypothetical protein
MGFSHLHRSAHTVRALTRDMDHRYIILGGVMSGLHCAAGVGIVQPIPSVAVTEAIPVDDTIPVLLEKPARANARALSGLSASKMPRVNMTLAGVPARSSGRVSLQIDLCRNGPNRGWMESESSSCRIDMAEPYHGTTAKWLGRLRTQHLLPHRRFSRHVALGPPLRTIRHPLIRYRHAICVHLCG